MGIDYVGLCEISYGTFTPFLFVLFVSWSIRHNESLRIEKQLDKCPRATIWDICNLFKIILWDNECGV